MHDSVRERLEEYLHASGSVPGTEEHLRTCESCREEVDAMRAQSLLFEALKPPAETEPAGGFYARVMNRIEMQNRPSVWSLFADSLFAKRLVYASAMLLLLFGTALVSSNQEDTVAVSRPEAILAGQDLPEPVTMDPRRDREVVLVNLATYQTDRGYAAENAGYSQEYQ